MTANSFSAAVKKLGEKPGKIVRMKRESPFVRLVSSGLMLDEKGIVNSMDEIRRLP